MVDKLTPEHILDDLDTYVTVIRNNLPDIPDEIVWPMAAQLLIAHRLERISDLMSDWEEFEAVRRFNEKSQNHPF